MKLKRTSRRNPYKRRSKKTRYVKRYRRKSRALRLSSRFQLGFPDEMYTRMRFFDNIEMHQSAMGSTAVSTTWVINTLFKVDTSNPATINYQAAYQTLYSNYKVYGLAYKVSFYNNTSKGIEVLIGPTTEVSPFAITGQSGFDKLRGNPMFKTALLPASVNYPFTIRGYIPMIKLVGDTSFDYDKDYTGTTGGLAGNYADPTTKLYLQIAAASQDFSNFSGLQVQVDFMFHVKFFNKVIQQD